jgi:hypothetical protein
VDIIMLRFLLGIIPTRCLNAALLALLLCPIVCSHPASAEGYVATFFSKDFVREGVFSASGQNVVLDGRSGGFRHRLNKPKHQSAGELSHSGQHAISSFRSFAHQAQPKVFVDGTHHSGYSEWDVRSGQQ